MGDEHDSWLNDLGIDLGKIFGGGATTETDSSNRQKPAGQGLPISKSVGKGGKNNAEDVKIVQAALNRKIGAGLAIDGDCAKKTVAAIRVFQKSLGMSNPDGRVDPGKGTAKALARADAPPQPPGDPGLPGKLDLSLRNPKPPVPVKHDSEGDDSGDLLDRIVKGVEDLVDDVIQPGGTPEWDTDRAEREFQIERIDKITDRIIAKLKARGSLKVEIQQLEGTEMWWLLRAMDKLKEAHKLQAFADQLTDKDRRVGAAFFTIKPQFNEVWRERVCDLSPKDREAILERTPEADKKANGFGEEPTDPEHTEPGENPAERKITVDDKGIAVAASLTFKSQEKNFGKTEFTVQLDPTGNAKAFDLNLTLIARNLNEEGFLAGFLGKRVALNVSLSLNASVELTKKQTKTVLKEVRAAVKAEVELRFKLIPVLKRVSLKFSVTGGAQGVSFGPALAVSF